MTEPAMTPAFLRGLGLGVGAGEDEGVVGEVDEVEPVLDEVEPVLDEVEPILDEVGPVDVGVIGAMEVVGFNIEELGTVETTTN